jgi:DNA-binding NtrC family response regulator
MPEIVAESPQMKEVCGSSSASRCRIRPFDYGRIGDRQRTDRAGDSRLSRRHDKSFVDLNCAALQDNLLESELFGHEAGAFSGARGPQTRLFEIADSGTLLSRRDHGNADAAAVETASRAGDALVFSASAASKSRGRRPSGRRDEPQREKGRRRRHFPLDLLYRVNSFEINIPPLRERREDIEPLAKPFATRSPARRARNSRRRRSTRCARSIGRATSASSETVSNAPSAGDNGRITIKELPPEVIYKMTEPSVSVSYTSRRTRRQLVPERFVADRSARRRAAAIINALEKTGWHRGKTAELLGISPSTLYRRLREYDLETR